MVYFWFRVIMYDRGYENNNKVICARNVLGCKEKGIENDILRYRKNSGSGYLKGEMSGMDRN